MRKLIGSICVLLGVLCIFGSVSVIVYNRWDDKKAEDAVHSILENVKSVMDGNCPEQENTEMVTVKVDDYECIGVLSIPVLNLELPVLTDWSYDKLKKAPCHYYGSYNEKDFVIAAHNYNAHFGRLSELQAGDKVIFTDAKGTARYYDVVIMETLPPKATKEMITSGFDLSLYTCTSGGASRVTVRCTLSENQQ